MSISAKKIRHREKLAADPQARYIQWMRLTHNGRRLPSHPACSECKSVMTGKQVAEYQELQDQHEDSQS